MIVRRMLRAARGGLWSTTLVWACSSTAPAPSAPAVAPPSEPLAAPRAAQPEAVVADASLDIGEYVATGVPDPSAPWTIEQYERAAEALGRSAASGRASLPRRASSRSGVLFSRLVAEEIAGSSGASATEQAGDAARSVAVTAALCGLYAPGNDGKSFTSEQVAMIGALLRRLGVALERSRLLAGTDAEQGRAYEQQKRVVMPVVRGALSMLVETNRYSPAERAELRALVSAEQAVLLAHLGAAERGALTAELASLSDGRADREPIAE